ncbi:SGNH hydrolase [Nonomuraea sp. WAC 01424]|uniref:SGNH/GDSL hydrolase family protein n=1 Tax=Nonomuraea sp. WAC 01424 TaxID=2203200 RepID=UPI000F7A9264|nr:SGNH/GDSL hydrolase family protein [Nonomuraea sp. WAC 01424]RSN06589.1 SGNH hydrolase [Nonomuraea sp. WAC 01424]
MGRITTYVALGDSFTEGLEDPAAYGFRGWADRLAEHIEADRLQAGQPGLRYANLAVRGRLIDDIVSEQVPKAVELGADLVSLCAGGNDILRPGSGPASVAKRLEQGVRTLTEAGARVLMFTGFDLRHVPVMRLAHSKIEVYNLHIHDIARRYDALLVDLWPMTVFRDARAWNADRLHLSPDGHRRVALRAAEVLGVPVDADWREPYPVRRPPVWTAARREDLRWARTYLGPWIGRRINGRSSGDGALPKRPNLAPLTAADH